MKERITLSARGAIVLFVFLLAQIIFLIPSFIADAAPANTITVNTVVDEDASNANCSLREAIIAANTNVAHNGCSAGSAGADTINIGVPGTITLTSTLPAISETLTINGNAGGTTISGNNSNLVLVICATNSGGNCNFTTGPTVNLSGLTIANGYHVGGTGGLFAYNATLNITNSTFISNTAPGTDVAGAMNTSLGILNVSNSTFSNNSAFQGGAIYSSGTAVTITQSTFTGNLGSDKGGAVYVESSSGFGFVVINSTFYSNTVGYGGALVNNSSTTLINDTLSNNRGITGTGGITSTGGEITLMNTIVANSVGNNCGNAVLAILSNGGNNMDSGTTCGFGSSNGSISSANPRLGAFGNYGGATKLLPLLPGSPAIDAASDAICATAYPDGANSVDQRGVPRPIGAHCDIGAYEAPFLLNLPLIIR